MIQVRGLSGTAGLNQVVFVASPRTQLISLTGRGNPGALALQIQVLPMTILMEPLKVSMHSIL